jgi:PAS domain S-box-containing protein
MNNKRLFNRKMQLALGSAVLAFLAVCAISYRGMLLLSEGDRSARNTREVVMTIQNLLSELQNVQMSCRGFLLTGKESYLEAREASISSVEQDEATIRRLTVDHPERARQIPAFEKLAAQTIQFDETTMNLRRTKGLQAPAVAFEDESGQQVLDEFQRKVREMQDDELRLLGLRDMYAKRCLRQAKIAATLGTVLGLLIVATTGWSEQRDISQPESAEEGLRISEENYRLLLDGVQDYAIFRLDPHGRVVSWNAGAERIKGYKAGEIIGQNFARFYLQKDIDQHKPEEQLRVAATTGRSEVEQWRVRKDGSQFWANVVITATRDSSGHLLGFSEISRDMSERKETEAKYRGLLEAAPDAMVVVDQSGQIVLLNVQAERQFGYHRNELLGQKVKNIIPEGFSERLIADGTRTAAEALAQQIGTGIELLGRRKDGSEFPIEIMLSPLESLEGMLVTAAIRDITERKRSEEHLFKTVGELKRSNEELQQFAYVASHDLQEPLRMVASYTQLLARRYQGRLDSNADEFIAFAKDGCDRMQALIHDLLTYSRAGTNDKELGEISCESALKEALANLRTTIEQSGAVVTHDSLPALKTNERQLAQVFQNLVGNAIKYRGTDVPHVHVSAMENDGKEWIFSVRDNGLGIEPQYFERIFVLFQRLHGREEFKGTGIGLAVCKKIVERLGGRIWVESQPEKGSTFYFTLPEGEEK